MESEVFNTLIGDVDAADFEGEKPNLSAFNDLAEQQGHEPMTQDEFNQRWDLELAAVLDPIEPVPVAAPEGKVRVFVTEAPTEPVHIIGAGGSVKIPHRVETDVEQWAVNILFSNPSIKFEVVE